MAETQSPSRGRRLVFAMVPSLALLLLLAAIELGVRLTRPHVDSIEWLVAAPAQRAQFTDRRDVRIFEGDPLLFWKLRPDLDRVIWDLTLVSTNREGLRYPRAVGRKTPGTFRIVCLGDSVTFGYRVPRVLPRDPSDFDPSWLPYPALLEQKLRAAYPGRSIEVIPAAVPGYSSHQGRLWLERDLERWDPDLVTACYGWNDINRRGRSDRAAMSPSAGSVAVRRLLGASQAAVHIGLWLRARAPNGPAPDLQTGTMRVSREEYVENLLAMARRVRARGTPFVLLGPVYRDRTSHPPEGDDIAAHREALRDAAAREGFPYVDFPQLREDHYPANLSLFEEHIHPNHKGHKLMADRLLAFLTAQRLLPEAGRDGQL